MSVRPSKAKGAYTGTRGGGGGGGVEDVFGVNPIQSSGGANPEISLAGLTGFGAPGQSIWINSAGTGFEYYTPGAEQIDSVRLPLNIVAGELYISGLSTLGNDLEFPMSTGPAGWTYVGSTGALGNVVLSDAPTIETQLLIQGLTDGPEAQQLLILEIPGHGTTAFEQVYNYTGDNATGARFLAQGVEIWSGAYGTYSQFKVSADRIGLYSVEPVEQPTVPGTAAANPVTDTGAFMNQYQQMLSGLLAIGALRAV